MAAALSFNEMEKMIQEKLFYKILFYEYFKNDHIAGHGYKMTKESFVIEILFLRQLSIAACNELAEKIGKRYNVFVEKNQRSEKPRWAISCISDISWSYQFFIHSEHEESSFFNEFVKKMIRGY